jgi:DNA-binding MarR family transcriptional regulator
VTPIYARKDLTASEHRMIWFLIEAGAAKKPLAHGWLSQAARHMKMGRESMRRIALSLEKKGVVILAKANFTAPSINREAFESEAIHVRFLRNKQSAR